MSRNSLDEAYKESGIKSPEREREMDVIQENRWQVIYNRLVDRGVSKYKATKVANRKLIGSR